MKKITISLFLFLLLFLFLFSSVSLGAVPNQINYQGVLRNIDGSPMDGLFNMTFRIFSSPEGEDLLWEEEHIEGNRVTVDKGLYSVQLGSINSINDPRVFDGGTRYLEVEIGGEILKPKIPLVTVLYAYRSEITDSLSPAALQQVSTQTVTVPDPLYPLDGIQDIVGDLIVAPIGELPERPLDKQKEFLA
jgi:hypothetical protein